MASWFSSLSYCALGVYLHHKDCRACVWRPSVVLVPRHRICCASKSSAQPKASTSLRSQTGAECMSTYVHMRVHHLLPSPQLLGMAFSMTLFHHIHRTGKKYDAWPGSQASDWGETHHLMGQNWLGHLCYPDPSLYNLCWASRVPPPRLAFCTVSSYVATLLRLLLSSLILVKE